MSTIVTPIVRTAHYREVAWRIVADLVRAGVR